MDREDKGKSSSEMEDWIQELLPDFAGDMGLGKNGATDFPSSTTFTTYNQHNGSVSAPTTLININNLNSGMRPRQQPSAFPRPAWQQNRSNSYSTMRLGGLHPLPESITPTNWVDEAYHKVMQLKETISNEVLIFHRRAQQMRQSATTREAAGHYESMVRSAERVIRFVHMPRSDLAGFTKEKLYHTMNDAVKYYNHARFHNASTNNINAVQINNPARSAAAPPYQRQQPTGIDSRAIEMFLNNSARAEDLSVSDQASAKRQRGLGKKKEEMKPSRFSGLTGGQSSRVDGKDSPSSSSKPAAVSVSASSSALLSPMTPCSKPPSDFAKSPMSVDESCRLPPSYSDPPLMKPASANTVAADEPNTDPVKRLADAVMSMSPRALNSAIQDIDAVTSLTDRVAMGFLRDGSTKVVLRDLADDVSKFRKQSVTKDKMETGAGFCERGSAKRLRKEPRDFLMQEIKEINQRFMEVKVDVMNMDDVSRRGFDGDILVRCSYIPVGPASQQMVPKLLLGLIVPAAYPSFSPTVSDKMCPGHCDIEDGENLWAKAKSGFSLKLRKLGEPITVKQMARAWEDSAREVFLEYAERMGGGSLLSSTRCGYGNWDSLAVAF